MLIVSKNMITLSQFHKEFYLVIVISQYFMDFHVGIPYQLLQREVFALSCYIGIDVSTETFYFYF